MQSPNALCLIVVRLLGQVMEVSLVQTPNVSAPIVVRLSGKVIWVSPVQQKNASFSMVVRLSGRSTAISFLNLRNAFSLIASTPLGIVMRVTISLYGLTMSWVMNLVSSEKVKWVFFSITCVMSGSLFFKHCTYCAEYYKFFMYYVCCSGSILFSASEITIPREMRLTFLYFLFSGMGD